LQRRRSVIPADAGIQSFLYLWRSCVSLDAGLRRHDELSHRSEVMNHCQKRINDARGLDFARGANAVLHSRLL